MHNVSISPLALIPIEHTQLLLFSFYFLVLLELLSLSFSFSLQFSVLIVQIFWRFLRGCSVLLELVPFCYI
ncbi:hypothetical protein HMPREF1583_00682 [Gardnerella vaginalis JCP8151B]|nr:hypothetical protein HMPREF1583_00682 [Gardnerella vaginalis JCP8151B]